MLRKKRDSWESFRLQRGGGAKGVIFGFQHEDQEAEKEVFCRTQGKRALCICSGGEVALGLLAGGAEELVAVDLNPAQLELFKIKRCAILGGHFKLMSSDARGALKFSTGECSEFRFRIPAKSLRNGICFAGQVEQRAIRLGPLLRWFGKDTSLLRWHIGWKLIPLVVCLGYAAVFRRYLPDRWCERMKGRVEKVIKDGGNLWWSVELGERFGERGNPLYEDQILVSRVDNIELRNVGIVDVLHGEEEWDFIALSNIIDTMSEIERTSLFKMAGRRLRVSGRFVVRSMIFCSNNLPEIEGVEWEELPHDRSPICPIIGVGKKI